MALLKPAPRNIVDAFLSSRTLPEDVGHDFVSALQEALSGLAKVVVTTQGLRAALLAAGSPATVPELKKRFEDYLVEIGRAKTPARSAWSWSDCKWRPVTPTRRSKTCPPSASRCPDEYRKKLRLREKKAGAIADRFLWYGSGTFNQFDSYLVVKVRDILRNIEEDGWRFHSQKGSHRQFVHPVKPGRVTVPGKPGDDLGPKLTAEIFRQAQFKPEN